MPEETTRFVPQVPRPVGITMPSLTAPLARSQQRRAPGADLPKGPFIKYVGPCVKRIIRPHQWVMRFGSAEPLKNPGSTHEWSPKNRKLVAASEFSDAQLDYLLIDDMQARGGHSFVVVDYDANGNLVEAELPPVEVKK